MVFSSWQIGLDIQCDGARAVALSLDRRGACLRRWWYFPHSVSQATGPLSLPDTMADWHRQLPLGARLRVSFAGLRLLQQSVAAEPEPLNEAQRALYLAATVSKQLRMSAAELSLDYRVQPSGHYTVSAARREEIDALSVALRRYRLTPQAIAPAASALQGFLPFITAQGHNAVIYQAADRWLWASAESWGVLSTTEAATASALCLHIHGQASRAVVCQQAFADATVPYFDPWRALVRVQPPLPDDGDRYAVALGLALARVA